MADPADDPRLLRYDPAADAARRFPDWTIAMADLGGVVPEVLCLERRVILIEREQSVAGQRSSLAHAVAHLDLGHGWTTPGFFENREEAEADRLAAGRLIPLDAFAAAICWAGSRAEVAAELAVDLPMLRAREDSLSRAERRWLRRSARAGAVSV